MSAAVKSDVDKYMESVDALAAELDSVGQILGSSTPDEWSRPTLLVPVYPVPNWTILELAGHLGHAMTMVDTLLAKESPRPPALDRVSFYDQPKRLVAPLVFQTAADVVAGKTGAEMLQCCLTSFSDAMATARLADPAFVGSTVIGSMRVDEFIATRIVEVVVHGLDLVRKRSAALQRRRRAPSIAPPMCWMHSIVAAILLAAVLNH